MYNNTNNTNNINKSRVLVPSGVPNGVPNGVSSGVPNGLPSNNISQQLYDKDLPNCSGNRPAGCCKNDLELGLWYKKAPVNLWNTASNYQGGPPFSSCTDDAFTRQCFLSQYYNYLSKNNVLSKN